MDAQKQSCQSKNIVDRTGETEHRKDLTAYSVPAGYQIDSQQHVGNESERTACLDAHNGVAARNHLGRPTGSTEPEALPSSPIAHHLLCASTDNAPHSGMLIPSCKHFTDNMCSALKFAVSNPPVTTSTLIELDLNWILHNIHLRSDINFENDLHFMPVKGKRAEQKHKEGQKYWLALAAELQIHLHPRLACLLSDQNEKGCVQESFEPRLPQMFAHLRELLETLVPDRDHVSIAGNLDVPFLMQQIENGVLDICQLAQWLTTLLKSHCAPIRDEWADQMTQQIEDGARRSDMILLVRGIERLFSMLEAMKLDVANHQIRTFRYHLMECTIPFQQQFFARRIVDGKIDSRSCRDWYHEARRQQTPWALSSNSAANVDGYPSLIQGIITTLFAMPIACVLPSSFRFDLKRLERIDSDTQDLLHLRMAMLVFDELRLWLTLGRANTVSPERSLKLQSRILAIVDEQVDNEDPWQVSSADVALEITRAAYTICGSSEVAVPDSVIQRAHLRLDDLRCGLASECALIKDILQVELTIKAIHYAQVFNDKTPLEMSDAQQQWRQQRERNTSFHPLPEIEDIARRVAHVGIIHWKIWANLVYLDEVEVMQSEFPSPFNPPSAPHTGDRTGTTSVLSSSIEMAVD